MTEAQARWLADIKEAGVKVYNGRGRQTIKALESLGLVEVEWASSLSQAPVDVIVVWPTGYPSYRQGDREPYFEWRARIRNGDYDV